MNIVVNSKLNIFKKTGEYLGRVVKENGEFRFAPNLDMQTIETWKGPLMVEVGQKINQLNGV